MSATGIENMENMEVIESIEDILAGIPPETRCSYFWKIETRKGTKGRWGKPKDIACSEIPQGKLKECIEEAFGVGFYRATIYNSNDTAAEGIAPYIFSIGEISDYTEDKKESPIPTNDNIESHQKMVLNGLNIDSVSTEDVRHMIDESIGEIAEENKERFDRLERLLMEREKSNNQDSMAQVFVSMNQNTMQMMKSQSDLQSQNANTQLEMAKIQMQQQAEVQKTQMEQSRLQQQQQMDMMKIQMTNKEPSELDKILLKKALDPPPLHPIQ